MRLTVSSIRQRPERLAPRLSEAEFAAHREFVASLGENALWREYRPDAG
jgi:DNA polymerase-3 subunit epsilon